MPYPYTTAYTTKTINGWYGDELHYVIEGRTVGAILLRSTISNSTKQNYIFDQRFAQRPRQRGRGYYNTRLADRGLKKYFVVISNLPTIAGPFYYEDAVNHMERILSENA